MYNAQPALKADFTGNIFLQPLQQQESKQI
jgi:hypothetical protein